MLEKHVHPAIKDGLSFTTRSLLFCLLSALWHIDTLPTETVYNFVSLSCLPLKIHTTGVMCLLCEPFNP